MEIGQKLKELRIDYGYTQKALAKMLNISQQALSHYEMGDRDISIDLIKKICVLFDITSDEFLDIDNKEERKKISIKNSFNNSTNKNIRF